MCVCVELPPSANEPSLQTNTGQHQARQTHHIQRGAIRGHRERVRKVERVCQQPRVHRPQLSLPRRRGQQQQGRLRNRGGAVDGRSHVGEIAPFAPPVAAAPHAPVQGVGCRVAPPRHKLHARQHADDAVTLQLSPCATQPVRLGDWGGRDAGNGGGRRLPRGLGEGGQSVCGRHDGQGFCIVCACVGGGRGGQGGGSQHEHESQCMAGAAALGAHCGCAVALLGVQQ